MPSLGSSPVLDSSLLALPAAGGLSALFGGFEEEEEPEGQLAPFDATSVLLVAVRLAPAARTRLLAASRSFAVVLRSESRWRTLLLSQLPSGARIDFRRSWCCTALSALRERSSKHRRRQTRRPLVSKRFFRLRSSPKSCLQVRSKASHLERPASVLPWLLWLQRLPLAIAAEDVPALQLPWNKLSKAALRRAFRTSQPFLGSGALLAYDDVVQVDDPERSKFFGVKGWPADWAPDKLQEFISLAVCPRLPLLSIVAPLGKTVQMTMLSFLSYAKAKQEQDEPLYLFDSGLVASKLMQRKVVAIPALFEDLFDNACTVDSSTKLLRGLERQYLTIGPPGSGARFHVDPFAASAVSLLLRGRKVWALFPPDCRPPGVRCVHCEDRLVHESPPASWWFRHVYLAAGVTGGKFFIQEAGDIVFTPSGWWHCTLNLGPDLAVALTKHICTPDIASRVAAELRRDGWGDAATWLAGELRARHA